MNLLLPLLSYPIYYGWKRATVLDLNSRENEGGALFPAVIDITLMAFFGVGTGLLRVVEGFTRAIVFGGASYFLHRHGLIEYPLSLVLSLSSPVVGYAIVNHPVLVFLGGPTLLFGDYIRLKFSNKQS